MHLRDKTFPMEKGCELISPCPETPIAAADLFTRDWEVFVIKHDKASGKHTWFTLCCELADAMMHQTMPANS